MIKHMLAAIVLFCCVLTTSAQDFYEFSAKVEVSQEMKDYFKEDGRLLLFINMDENSEPRNGSWPNPYAKNWIFGKNVSDFNSAQGFEITGGQNWTKTGTWGFNNIPEGTYYMQLVWDQNEDESRANAVGNLYSKPMKVEVNKASYITITLENRVPEHTINEHALAKTVRLKSELLSKFWDKPMFLNASVLLPNNYEKGKPYPIRYNVAGYGGRFTRINRLLNSKNFMEWWTSGDAPEVINVFLDGEGPFGDSYQMDSENSGPYGASLITELIPFIEKEYRGSSDATYRFVDGCSTGGWVSLGLQLYYPDTFNGCFSYSPDAVEFENYQLINAYEDVNAFQNRYGYERPVMRDVSGEPLLSLRDFIKFENALGASDTYLNSGGQFSAHTALYSPKGENGLPKPMFDPVTGVIDKSVVEHWKKYDFKIHAKENWATLGPKLQGKIYVWMGDMDHFYLNQATRMFSDFLKTTENPKSDAVIEFTATEGHCQQFSDFQVLKQIQARIEQIN